MKIEFLEGYQNSFSEEDNSVTLRINTGPLNQHLNEAINNENIYNIMSGFTKEYKYITFYHTFRLGHNDKEYCKQVTNYKGVLYETSKKYEANGDNLQDQLQKSLMSLFDELTYLGDHGWDGVHFINIMMKKNDTIVNIKDDERRKIKATHKKTATRKYMFNDDTNDKKQKIKATHKKTATRGYMFNDDTDDERQKIKATHKKTATRGYMFNDDTDDDTEKNNLFETKTKKVNNKKKDNNKPSANKNSRCNNSTIQYGGGSHFKQSNHILMDEINLKNLKNLSKSELINLILKQQKSKIIVEDKTKPSPKPMRPVPTPRKSVKDMVQQYEDNIISPPPEFRDDYKPIPPPKFRDDYKPIPTPKTKKPSEKPVPEKRTII